jgi:hypothetical protein
MAVPGDGAAYEQAAARDGGAAPNNTRIGAMGATRSVRRATRARAVVQGPSGREPATIPALRL